MNAPGRRSAPRSWSRKIAAGIAVVSAYVGSSCGGDAPSWSEPEHIQIYIAALESIRREVGIDTLIVEPRPRFVIGEAGSFVMGDFSEFGDPMFSAAIERSARVLACGAEPGSGCGRAAHPRLVTVSEVAPLGVRDAGVLASYMDLRRFPIVARDLRIQLRFADGSWRVVRITDGDGVRSR